MENILILIAIILIFIIMGLLLNISAKINSMFVPILCLFVGLTIFLLVTFKGKIEEEYKKENNNNKHQVTTSVKY